MSRDFTKECPACGYKCMTPQQCEAAKVAEQPVGYPPLDPDIFESAFNVWRYDTDESKCDRDAALRNAIQYYIDQAGLTKRESVTQALVMLHDMIDGGEECRGRDSEISDIIRLLEQGR